MVGGLLAGFLADFAGRKLGLMLCAVPYSAGWALVAYGENIAMLYASRVLVGLGVGMSSLMVPVSV